MNKYIVIFLFISTSLFSQETIDTTKFLKPPKNPTIAAFASAIFPGAGQIYNGKYWKVPIIYAAIGASGYYTYTANYYYKLYLHDLWLLEKMNDGDTAWNQALLVMGIYDEDQLREKKNSLRRDRDLGLFITIGLWGLNILDAYVDAQLSNFDVSDDLSMSVKPFLKGYPFVMGITFRFTPNITKKKILRL